jgi:hypothetical protein
MGALSILEDYEQEREQFEGVSKNNDCEPKKEMQQPRSKASLRDQLLRDAVEAVVDEPPTRPKVRTTVQANCSRPKL